MELKAGYKMTELGVIPKDWEVLTLLELCSKITDGTHDTPKQVKDGIPFLTAIHVKENHIDFEGSYFLTNEDHRIIYNRCNPEKNDVLMVNIGAGVATTALVNVDYEFSLKNVALLKPKPNKLIGSFLNYWQVKSKQKIISSISTGGAQPFLSLNQIGNLKIPLPRILEQTAIATALSDADGLISSLEKLIAKKRNIKQGAMQKLLQPKEGWEVKSIQQLIAEGFIIGHLDGNHGELYPKSNEFLDNGIPYVGATDFFNEKVDFKTCKFLSIERAKTFKKGIAKDGDVLFAHNATVGPVALLDTHFPFVIISTTATYFRCDNINLINRFLLYILQSQKFISQYQSVMLQSTRAQVPIGQQRKFNLDIPNPIEQTRIANILSDMDTEIYALETKLEKYRNIKLGMMQNLLTGKIRLV